MSWLRSATRSITCNAHLTARGIFTTHPTRSIHSKAAQILTRSSLPHRHFSSTPLRLSNSNTNTSSPSSSPTTPPHDAANETSSEPRMAIAFTCTVQGCGERSAHHFTKRAYEKGVVLIQCPKCKNKHLIADNLGWFKESTQDGKLKTVEDLLREKGESVTRGRLDIKGSGVVEFSE